MRFTKMQGLGNDYVYLDCTKAVPPNLPELAVKLSDRHFGVGSDGLICVLRSEKADVRMRMFNADGSEGEMCGNGIRCVGKFVYDTGLIRKQTVSVETLAGVKRISMSLQAGEVQSVTVDMGAPQFEEACEISRKGTLMKGLPVSMGNPHVVFFVDNAREFALPELAPLALPNPAFPKGVNVEIAEVLDAAHIRVRVWERGSGETLACGTGACAVLAAAASEGRTERAATVCLPGGELSVRWDESDGHIYMTGPAVTVFEGDWPD